REEWSLIVVHDLRQPISAIVLRSELLLDSELGEQQRDDVRHVLAAAQRLDRMANDLNDASLLETHRLTMTLERLDLGALVRDVVQQVPGAPVRTTVAVPDGQRLLVKGDAQRLAQVIANLLSNALKYGAEGSPIVVSVEGAGGD